MLFFAAATSAYACSVLNTDTTLAQNFTVNGSCMEFNASDITLDCAGFTLTGNGTGDGVNFANNVVNSTVKNCNIRNFSSGVEVNAAANITIRDNNITNVTGNGVFLNSIAGGLAGGTTRIFGNFINASTSAVTPFRPNAHIENNTLIGLGNEGINGGSDARNMLIVSNDITGNQAVGLRDPFNTLRDNQLTGTSTFGALAILAADASNNTFTNNVITGTSTGFRIVFDGGVNNTFYNTTLMTDDEWVRTTTNTNATFTNTTFNNSNGYIRLLPFFPFPADTTLDTTILNITLNRAFLNSTAIPALNVSGEILLDNITLNNPQPIADFDNDGTFEPCPANICTELSFNGSTYEFNTTHFSAFAAAESCGNVSTSTELNVSITSNDTCINIIADDVTLDCQGNSIFYNANGGDNEPGINATGRANVTIRNCLIRDVSNTGSANPGILFSTTTNSLITDSTIKTNGTDDNRGVEMDSNAHTNTISNNTITTVANGTANEGLRVESANNTLVNNILSTSGDISNHGIRLTGPNNNVTNNTISTNGTAGANIGVNLGVDGSNNIISQNTISTSGASTSIGINDAAGNNTITGNTITTINGSGIVTNAPDDLVVNNNVTASGGHGIQVQDQGNTFDRNTLTATGASQAGVAFVGNGQGNFTNTLLDNPVLWIQTIAGPGGNFTNTTFQNPNGSIRIPGQFEITTKDIFDTNLDITSNRAFLNSTELPTLNQTGIITLNNITLVNPQPFVDFDDDGVFEICPKNVCTELSFDGSTYVFNTTHFTSFTTVEGSLTITLTKTDNPDPVSPNAQLNYTLTVDVNGTALNVTLEDILPANVTFVNSTPPANVSNTTFFLGNLTNETVNINITVLVDSGLPDGFVLTNNATLNFTNTTFSQRSINVSEPTTIQLTPQGVSVGINKTDSQDPVVGNNTLTYTITVEVNGTAFDLNVTDLLPAGVTFINSTPPANISNTTYLFGDVTDQNISINITVQAGDLANGTLLNNTARVNFTDINTNQFTRTDTEGTTVLAANPALTITKTDTPDPVNNGSQLNYTITVTVNSGQAFNVTVTDLFPGSVTFANASPTPTGSNDTFVLGTMSAGDQRIINITVLVNANASDGSILNNTANVTYGNSTGDALEDRASALTTVNAPAPPAPARQAAGGGGGGGGSGITAPVCPEVCDNPRYQHVEICRTCVDIQQPACTEQWSCSFWTPCENGKQYRTCNDLAACGTTIQQPATERSCNNVAQTVQQPQAPQPPQQRATARPERQPNTGSAIVTETNPPASERMSGWLSQLTTATAQAAQKVKTATTVRLNALSRIIKNNVLTAQASSYATLGLGLLAILLLVLIIKPGHYFKREPDAHDGLKKNEQHLKKMSNRLKKLK